MSFFEFITSPLMGVYFISALFGGSLMFLQFLLMFFGIGGDAGANDFGEGANGGTGGVEGHAHSMDIFKMLSLRTIVAGIAFFGLGGLAGLAGGTSQPISVFIAVVSGLAAVYAVYFLYRSAAKLNSDGSISQTTLVGSTGNVYIRIPAAKNGSGKVLISQQDRTMEYEAVTAGEELKANVPVVVIRVVSPNTVEVTACE